MTPQNLPKTEQFALEMVGRWLTFPFGANRLFSGDPGNQSWSLISVGYHDRARPPTSTR